MDKAAIVPDQTQQAAFPMFGMVNALIVQG
jgi:hypothetical protein